MNKNKTNIGNGERLASGLIAAGLLGVAARKRKAILGLVGAEFLRRAVSGQSFLFRRLDTDTRRPKSFTHSEKDGIYRTRRSVTVNRPRAEVYAFWRNTSNFNQFMLHLKQVERLDANRSRWTFEVPSGQTIQWISEITEDVPDERISWKIKSDSKIDLHLQGTLRFVTPPNRKGTEVHQELQYRIPGGKLVWALAKVLGREPDQQLRANLRRFKKLIETGEIITTEGQPSGRMAA